MAAVVGLRAARAMAWLARTDSPLTGEPRRSSWTPGRMAELLAKHGFGVRRDDDLLNLADGLGLRVTQRRSLRDGRVLVAERLA